MSIAEQVDALERAGDGYRHAIAELTRMNEMIIRDRDQWKARAEAAELQKAEAIKAISTYESNRDYWLGRAKQAETQLRQTTMAHESRCEFAAEQRNRADAAEKRVKELEERCNHRGRAVEELDARIAELERQLSSRPSTLEAVLEECRIAGICAGVGVVDRQEFRIHVDNSCGISRVTYAPDASSAASAIESIVCDRDFYPHSSFARRRKVEPTPNYSKTSNSSTDPVEELSDGDWYVSFARNGVIDISAKGGGIVVSCGSSHATKEFVETLCIEHNRYRRIVEAVNHPIVAKYVGKSPISLEHWNNLRAALRPLLKQEAAK